MLNMSVSALSKILDTTSCGNISPPTAIYENVDNSSANLSYSRYCLILDGVVNVRASGFCLLISSVSSSIFLTSSSSARTTSKPNVKLMKSSRNVSKDTVVMANAFFILEYAL